ncbi:hypothetical protein QBC34DRAFT_497020 [Podospora aff. communis PSN243]|uniref:Uncharacterized protein n=1 Tax=Podospora aff. communis PSN243 TaxID=3040156 RepID=A0AAV9GG05_9PEZI|nr:hypothetical protein QBC34DRAFT_497020 [Podospora aff. communis PSN243]
MSTTRPFELNGIIPPGVPHKILGGPLPDVNYANRYAIRYLAFTPNGRIGVSYPWPDVPKHRLPGGFIDGLAGLDKAVEVEFFFSTGGRVTPRGALKARPDGSGESDFVLDPPVATSEEWQSVEKVGVRQITLCFLADFSLETGDPEEVTDAELRANGRVRLGQMGVDEAREAIAGEKSETPVAKVIRERDLWFLELGLEVEGKRKAGGE